MGLQLSELPHKVHDAVVGGENMILTRSGRYGCRPGYSQYGDDAIGERLLGGAFFRDVNLVPHVIVAGPSSWFVYDVATDSWTDITDSGDTLNGDQNTPVRFTTFFQSNKVWTLGTNNIDNVKRWEPSLANYTEIAASVPAQDITVLANRVILANTIESSVRYAARVRWSAESDATTYPVLGFFDLGDAGDPIVGVRNISRTSAVIYRTRSIWLLTAQAGGDATAFIPEQLVTDIDGPVSPSAIVAYGRLHYFIGRDSRAYKFDGVDLSPISDSMEPLLRASIATGTSGLIHGTVFAQQRQIWWWVVETDTTTPQIAFVYNIDSGQWGVLQRFGIGITMSLRAEEQRIGIWDLDNASWDSDESSWDEDLSFATLLLLLGSDSGLVYDFGRAVNDAGDNITFSWTLPIVYTGESSQLLVHEVEHFFDTPSGAQSVTVDVFGFKQPLGSATLLYTDDLDIASAGRLRSPSGNTNEFDTKKLYPGIQVAYKGMTDNYTKVSWGGGTLNVYPEVDG